MSWPNLTNACGGSLNPERLKDIKQRLSTYPADVRVEFHDFVALGEQMFSEPGTDIMEMEAEHVAKFVGLAAFNKGDPDLARSYLAVAKLGFERLERRLTA